MARSEFTVIPAEEGHCHVLAPVLREADLLELEASHTVAPLLGLLDAVRSSSYARAVLWGDRIAALFGVAPVTVETGCVWMLASDLADQHPAAFLRMCRRERAGLFVGGHERLINFIDTRNTKSLRWAEWLGFEVGEAIAYGKQQRPFFPVTLRR